MLLEKCGKISKWNRAADPNTSKLTSFGFCDFEEPQGVWRALQFLHDRQLCDKRLLVKCEEKAKQTINTWKDSRRDELTKRRAEAASKGKEAEKEKGKDKEEKEKEKDKEEKEQEKDKEQKDGEGGEDKKEGEKEEGKDKKDDGEEKPKKDGKEGSAAATPAVAAEPQGPLTEEQVEEELRKESKATLDEIARILGEKNKGYPEVKPDGEGEAKGEKVNGTAAKEAGKDGAEKEKSDDKENKDGNDKKKEESSTDKAGQDRDRQRSRSRDRRVARSEERRQRQKEEEKKQGPPAVSRHYRVSRRERERETRVRDRERDIDKEYQYRAREFERGEDKRITNLKRDLRDVELPSEPSDRDKRKFVEKDLDFGRGRDDEREWKRYREDRLDKRQREAEKDAADRATQQREEEEEVRKREEEERRKRKEEEEVKRKAREEAEAERKRQREEERQRREEELRKEQEELERKKQEEKQRREDEQKKQQEAAAAKLLQSVSACVQEEIRSSSADAALKTATGGASSNPGAQAMTALFRAGEEPLDANGQPRKHKPLTRLDGQSSGGGGGGGGGGGETKLKEDDMRRLIQQVPTDKAKAFAFAIDWDSVDAHNIVEKKLRPWVKKKVTEYLGSEEQGMIEFIMRKVSSRTAPDSILAELEGFLDEEAENFTLKMWRMLIFEVLRVKAR